MTTDKTIRVGALNYINSLPFFAAFQKGVVPCAGNLIYNVPTALNRALHAQKLDISLISSAEYLCHKENYTLITDACIGADGPVMSVLLYIRDGTSLDALDEQTVAVTAESASSTLLLKILCHNFWQIYPHFSTLNSIEETGKYAAFLLIGDPCLKNQTVPGFYTLDLADAWRIATGLPFTFAVFAAHNNVVEEKKKEIITFTYQLQQALQWAMENRQEIECLASERFALPIEFIRLYYTLLRYEFNEKQKMGLQKFEELAIQIENQPKFCNV